MTYRLRTTTIFFLNKWGTLVLLVYETIIPHQFFIIGEMAGLWEIWIQHVGISRSYGNQVSCFKKLLLSSQNKWRPSFRLAAVNTDKRRKRESPAHMIGGMWEPGVALGALSSVWVLSIRSIKSSHASKKTGQSKWVHQGLDMTQRTSFQIYSPFQWSVLWESICKIPWERKVKQRWRECVVGASPEIRILCVPVHSRWPQSFIWMPDPLGLHIFSVFLP